MDDLISVLSKGVAALIAAHATNDTAAQAQALADLNATIAAFGAATSDFETALATNKAQALAALAAKFGVGSGSGAGGAQVATKP